MTKCSRCDEYKKQLDTRDLNTKVWIEADYLCRDYANQLEKQLLLAMVALTKIDNEMNHSQIENLVRSTVGQILAINPNYPMPECVGWVKDKGRANEST